MPGHEQPDVPIWAAAKARKQIDVLGEVAKSLAQTDLERAGRPVAKLTEGELGAEQFRLEEMLIGGTLTVEDFRRLHEIDYYLEGMRQRREGGPSREGWSHESLSD